MKKWIISLLALAMMCVSAVGFTACDALGGLILPQNFNGADKESSLSDKEDEIKGDLLYTLSEDRTYYSVTDIGECMDTDLVIPAVYQGLSVAKIDAYAFYNCIRLTSVVIPDGVTRICGLAFSGCSGLKSVVIPKSVTGIGGNAFRWCNRLENITFEGTIAEWNAIEKGGGWNYRILTKEVICSDGSVSLK